MTKKLTQAYIRSQVWRHNALQGKAARALNFLEEASECSTATPEARELAARLRVDLEFLASALKERVDP